MKFSLIGHPAYLPELQHGLPTNITIPLRCCLALPPKELYHLYLKHDKKLTESCGILDKLLPGDVVLADRGFDVSESVGMMQARLHIPAFTRGKSQLSAIDVENTRTIANVRIHVERVSIVY